MNKKEVIIMKLLNDFASHKNEKNFKLTQLELSKKLGVSLSTVNNALKPLESIGAINMKREGIFIKDFKKALLYLASIRNLKKDIIYETFIQKSVNEIEKSIPSKAIYTMFSGFKFIFDEAPADYSEVYVYTDENCLEEIKKRFPEKKGPSNFFALKPNELLKKESKDNIVPLIQIYIDLWNSKEWYAKEFLIALEKKLKIGE